jgi:hypothetical protein
MRHGFSLLAAGAKISLKTAIAAALAARVHPKIGVITLNTVCSHQKKFDGRFCLDIVILRQTYPCARASRQDFHRSRAHRFRFSIQRFQAGRDCVRVLVVHSTFSEHGMNSSVAQATGFIRFSPWTNANPIFSTDLAPNVAHSTKLNLLISNNF